jgi:anti-sigma regulatory factor (Ser/Thr protein kinase)
MHTIDLPRHLEGGTFRLVSAQVPKLERIPAQATIDFSNLQFISPVGVTYLSNLINWLEHHGCEVTISYDDENRPALRYLDDSLFFYMHARQKLKPASTPRSTTQPLQKITHEKSHAWLDQHLIPWISLRIGYTRASLLVFQTCMAEIFNNIKDHSALDIGCIFVQHFPNLEKVSISIADFGNGIPNTVRNINPDLDDFAAIMQAVQLGFTSGSLPTNRGIGLDYLLQSVVLHNRGEITIFSLNGAVRFVNSGGSIRGINLPSIGFCPGTTIDICLRTDTIVQIDDEEEELEW